MNAVLLLLYNRHTVIASIWGSYIVISVVHIES